MREVVNLNQTWAFSMESKEIPEAIPANWLRVNLPHSWNSADGQDGGNDYYRGRCLYAKKLIREELPQSDEYWLEINGANSSADVYLNGTHLKSHDGGYSTWRVLLPLRDGENTLVVAVDNSANDRVYPQKADFTFYGGLYRSVKLICTEKSHFSLDYYGSPGIATSTTVEGKDALVRI